MFNTVVGIIIGLISLSLMMLLHELGHYVAGRLLGFKVIEFSLFMGPRIFSKVYKGIRYSIKSLPIGASVEFAGEYPTMDNKLNPNQIASEKLNTEEAANSDDDLTPAEILARDKAAGIFYAQAKWKRFIVMAAGPAMNLISGFIAFTLFFAWTTAKSTELLPPPPMSTAAAAHLIAGDKIISYNGFNIKTDMDLLVAQKFPAQPEGRLLRYERSENGRKVVKEVYLADKKYKFLQLNVTGQIVADKFVVEGSSNPAILPKDEIISVDGEKLTSIPRLYKGDAAPKSIIAAKVKLLRNGKEVTVNADQTVREIPADPGIYLKPVKGFAAVLSYSADFFVSVFTSTYNMLGLLFTGQLPAKDALAGPVGIVSIYSRINQAGVVLWEKFLHFTQIFALISLSLGMCNFLPIPPLDGSQIFLLFIEAVRGKRLSEKWENIYGYLGLVIVLGLALFTLFLDVLRLFRH